MPESNGLHYMTYRAFLTIIVPVMVVVLGGTAAAIWQVNLRQEVSRDSEYNSLKSDILAIKGDIINLKIDIAENKKEIRIMFDKMGNLYDRMSRRQESKEPKYFNYYGFSGPPQQEPNGDQKEAN